VPTKQVAGEWAKSVEAKEWGESRLLRIERESDAGDAIELKRRPLTRSSEREEATRDAAVAGVGIEGLRPLVKTRARCGFR
jgi:hypothetical protein